MFEQTIILKKRPFLFLTVFTILFLFFSVPNLFLNNSCHPTVHSKDYDPALNWKVIEGKQCLILFPKEKSDTKDNPYEQIALHIAEIAEELYAQITPQFGKPYNSNKKFAIILEDFSDSTYGYALTIPHRLIRINLTAPGFKIFDTKFESWLKILIAHEYTHLAHFDMTAKITSFLRFFLGQVITPNALQPLWSIEGLAIYNESKLTTGGRLRDNRYEMYLRADFLENRLKNLEQLEGGYLTSWPAGNTPYVYGQSLVHYIAELYGEEKLIDISKQFSSFPLLGMDWTLKKVLGIDQNELYLKWKGEKERHFKKQLEQIINSDGITKSQQITHHQYWIENPLWLTNSEVKDSTLLYKVFTPHLYPTIRQYDLTEKKESYLIKRATGQGTSYTLSPDYKYLLYPKLVQYEQHYGYNDLFLFHLASGKQYQLTEKMRIKDPAWHPTSATGKTAAVINQAGTNNLVLFSLKNLLPENRLTQKHLIAFSDLIFLTNFQDGTQISQPVWAPQGDRLAFSLWHKGYQDIYVITFDSHFQVQSIMPVTLDRYTDINPNWSADGQHLFFSSDRNGIFNIYVYSFADNRLFRLTNVCTGAFEPAISPSGEKMAFIQYHASGYELHLAKMSDFLWELIENPKKERTAELPTLKDKVICFPSISLKLKEGRQHISPRELKEYSPWDSIIPTYGIPYLNIVEKNLYLGFSTLAQDYLGFYYIPLTLAYNPKNSSFFYNFQFSCPKYIPPLSLIWQGETSSYTQLQLSLKFKKIDYTERGDSGRLYSEALTIGTLSKYLFTGKEQKDESSIKEPDVTNSLFLRYEYDDTEKYQRSISPEIGNSFSFSYQYALPYRDHEAAFHKILFDGRKYLPLPVSNQVLALRLVAGYSSNEINENAKFYLGGNASAQNLNIFNSKDFSLRGFPSSSFSGKHLLLGSLEYRFPLKRVERKIGYRSASIFLEQVFGTLFLEAGQTWYNTMFPGLEGFNISFGGEVGFRLKSRYAEPLTLAIGVGKAVTQTFPARFYARIGLSF